MAQGTDSPQSLVSASRGAPFPTPPGLDEAGTCEVGAVNAGGLGGEVRLEEICQAVLSDVDARVAEKAQALLEKGFHSLQQVQLKQKDRNERLAEEVSRCHERQQTLELENEKLRLAVAQLVDRFSMVSAVFGAQAELGSLAGIPNGLNIEGMQCQETPPEVIATTGPGSPPAAPVESERTGVESSKEFPPVPAFPLGTAASPTATPIAATPAAVVGATAPTLSLADALAQPPQTPQASPQRMQLSLANSLTATPVPPSPQLLNGSGSFVITLRKADGTDLGLNVSHSDADQVLHVDSVRKEGAVEAWNKQCIGTPSAEKAVMPGDQILQVNDVIGEPKRMLEECKDKLLLRLVVHRGAERRTASVLRAEASVFVPSACASPMPGTSKTSDISGEVSAGCLAEGLRALAGLHPEKTPEGLPVFAEWGVERG